MNDNNNNKNNINNFMKVNQNMYFVSFPFGINKNKNLIHHNTYIKKNKAKLPKPKCSNNIRIFYFVLFQKFIKKTTEDFFIGSRQTGHSSF